MCNLMVNGVKGRVPCFPKTTYYKPREIPLCDLLQIEPNEATDRMGISRKTFCNNLQNAGMRGNRSAMKDVLQTV